MVKPSLGDIALTKCAPKLSGSWPRCSWSEDCYLLRLYLPKLSKPASLVQVNATNPAALFVCIQQPCLSVQLYIIHVLHFQGVTGSPAKSPDHLSPAFCVSVCVRLFFIALLPPSGLSLEPCWMSTTWILKSTISFHNFFKLMELCVRFLKMGHSYVYLIHYRNTLV